jgi:hypothetical protein
MSISDLDPNVPGSDAPAGQGDDHLRAINSALKEAFPAVDGAITNTGAAGTAGDTDPPDAATWSQLFADVRALAGTAGAGASIQLGMMMLWSTANGAIPAGWTACNGVNINNVAVPVLEDRFVMGAGNTYSNGNVGGAQPGTQTTELGGSHTHTTSGHSLTLSELPTALSDNIQVSQAPTDQSDNHSDTTSLARGNATPTANTTLPMSVTGLGNAAHTHGDTAAAAAHDHALGAGTLPPFLALTWIIYVGVAA